MIVPQLKKFLGECLVDFEFGQVRVLEEEKGFNWRGPPIFAGKTPISGFHSRHSLWGPGRLYLEPFPNRCMVLLHQFLHSNKLPEQKEREQSKLAPTISPLI